MSRDYFKDWPPFEIIEKAAELEKWMIENRMLILHGLKCLAVKDEQRVSYGLTSVETIEL